MRLGIWAAVGFCALWTASAARAQSASTAMGGPNLTQLIQKPVDLSNAIAPSPGIAAGQNRFSFSALFNKLSIPGFPSKKGVSPLPPPGSFPSTNYVNYQMVNSPPLLLGQPRMQPFVPPAPVIPSMNTPVGPGSGN